MANEGPNQLAYDVYLMGAVADIVRQDARDRRLACNTHGGHSLC